MNVGLRTVLIAPLTTGSRPAPYRVEVAFDGRPGLILLDQVRAVDKRRLLKRLGEAPSDVLTEALAKLRAAFEP
jgi:mRNA interferase MazF